MYFGKVYFMHIFCLINKIFLVHNFYTEFFYEKDIWLQFDKFFWKKFQINQKVLKNAIICQKMLKKRRFMAVMQKHERHSQKYWISQNF